MNASLRGSVTLLVGSLALFVSSTALADGEACFVDTDCPGTACGSAVCNWTKNSPNPNGTKVYYCNPAGTGQTGSDGWCTTDADCKCMGEGAKCTQPYCTFTKAPAGSSGGASAGGAGGAPATTAGASSAGSPSAGSPSTAGAATTSDSNSDSGGCSISLPGKNTSGAAALLTAIGLGLVFARRRRYSE